MCVWWCLISTSCQVPRSVEFKFFSKILHLLAVQDESVLSEEPSSHCGPSAEELRCLAMKFLQRKERRKNIVHAQVARRVAEQEKMVALQNCLESILQHGVYQVTCTSHDTSEGEEEEEWRRRRE